MERPQALRDERGADPPVSCRRRRDALHRPGRRSEVRSAPLYGHDCRLYRATAVHCHLRDEIGRTDPMLLTERMDGPRLILLAGRSWPVLDRLETPAGAASSSRPLAAGMHDVPDPVLRGE